MSSSQNPQLRGMSQKRIQRVSNCQTPHVPKPRFHEKHTSSDISCLHWNVFQTGETPENIFRLYDTESLCHGTEFVFLNAGAALGSGFGGLAQAALSHTSYSVTAPAAYALVGVAGMLAANCQVPLTAVLLLFELTHDYFIIVRPSSPVQDTKAVLLLSCIALLTIVLCHQDFWNWLELRCQSDQEIAQITEITQAVCPSQFGNGGWLQRARWGSSHKFSDSSAYYLSTDEVSVDFYDEGQKTAGNSNIASLGLNWVIYAQEGCVIS